MDSVRWGDGQMDTVRWMDGYDGWGRVGWMGREGLDGWIGQGRMDRVG